MKKLSCLLVLACLITGCAARETMETVEDEMVMATAPVREILMELPEETVLPVMQTETGKIYICRDYEISVQTLAGGDLQRTVKTLTGFSPEDVTVMETELNGLVRHDLTWSCAGELGPMVGRASILSDGGYHYCLTAMTAEENARSVREIFNGMFESFTLR